MKTSRFITVEGGEGVGKSTNLQFIQQFLTEQQIPVILTREPGGTSIAEKIRSILLENHTEPLCSEAELLLIFAARAQHIQQVIKPALEQGYWVICDRFIDASYAYQGAGRGMDGQQIAWLEKMVLGDLTTDLTLLLDAPVDIGLARAKQRSNSDRFEIEQQDFFQRVRAAYLHRAEQNKDRYWIIDASLTLTEVQTQIKTALTRFLTV